MNSAMISGDLNHKDERRHLSPSLLRMKNAYVCTLQNCLILKKKQKKKQVSALISERLSVHFLC